ncbi:MAG: hypothetical protein KGI67_00005, partial [Pseudomonadota bacterium]|nr:hypothetical protein [Pseudomonadota bacterium]
VLLPRAELTPGEALPGCSIADLKRAGYSHSVRPSPGYTRHLKHDQLASGYQGRGLRYSCVEEDHLIPIGWCGNPQSARNLWPQLRASCGAPEGQSAEAKDACEYQGFALLRAGQLELAEAQRGVAQNWVSYCRDVVAPLAEKWHVGAPHANGEAE